MCALIKSNMFARSICIYTHATIQSFAGQPDSKSFLLKCAKFKGKSFGSKAGRFFRGTLSVSCALLFLFRFQFQFLILISIKIVWMYLFGRKCWFDMPKNQLGVPPTVKHPTKLKEHISCRILVLFAYFLRRRGIKRSRKLCSSNYFLDLEMLDHV